MTDTTARGAGPAERAHHAGGDGPAPERRRRMSAKRKQSAVLRLLRGEDLELVSRELGGDGGRAERLARRLPGRRRGVAEDPPRRWPRRRDRSPQGQGRRPDHGQRAAGDQDRAPGGRPPFGTAEVEAMSRQVSPSTNRSYGVLRVTRVWGTSRATLYRHRAVRRATPAGGGRARSGRCPTQRWSTAIRELLAASPFHGEGYRKVWARLRFAGIRTSKRRVLRLMREHDLLAPGRVGRPHGPKAHDGTIRTERVDAMWGTDLTSTLTGEGQASIFVTVDHCSTECVGIHAARAGDPLRGARAAPPGRARRLRRLRRGHRARPEAAPRPRQPVRRRRLPGRARASSASRARPPSCASPRATAASSASSAP